MPDIDLHCARVNASAKTMALKPIVSVEQWVGLVRDGMRRFEPDTTLYIRPMYWAERAGPQAMPPDPESTRWCLTLYEAPMRKPDGFAVTLSPFRRPTLDTAPVDAKAGCLYPNNARAMLEARSRGFDNCVVCDMLGNVAEFANSNAFIVKEGVIFTPMPNGTFLNGITRQRVIELLRTRRHGDRDHAALSGFRDRGRNLRNRQCIQGPAGHPHRRALAAAGADVPQGTRALLGVCARLTPAGRSQPRLREQGLERPSADVVEARIDHAAALDLGQHRRVELGAVEDAEHHREVGALRVPGGLEIRSQLDLRGAMRAADRDLPAAAGGLALVTFGELGQQGLRGLLEGEPQ